MEQQSRTIWRWLADWFAVRPPTRLVVDGVYLLFWSGLVHIAWSAWWSIKDESMRMNASATEKAISLIFSTLHAGLFDLGAVFVAVGCARIIAVRPTAAQAPTPEPPTSALPPPT